MSIKEQLLEEGLIDEDVFMPIELDSGFMGIALTDWHYGRALYDVSKLNGIEIPDTPEDMKAPIFVNTEFELESNEDLIVFDPKEYLNKAICGITDEYQAVYEYESLLEAMTEQGDEWDEETAADWISFNTLRDYSYRDKGPVVYQKYDYMLD